MNARTLTVAVVVVTALCGMVAVTGLSGEAAAQESAESQIQTDHFIIMYDEGMREEAQRVASFADEYHDILFQRFGVEPRDERTYVFLTSQSNLPCETADATGCYTNAPGAIYISDDDPGLFYHELVHHHQVVAGVSSPGQQPLEISIEGTATYLQTPDEEIASTASFSFDKDRYFTLRDADGEDYDELALFSEYLLHEYGREAFDVLFTTTWYWPGDGTFGDRLAEATDTEYPTIREGFDDQLRQQQRRMRSGGTPLPGFSYEPFTVSAGTEVTFDARTPEVIEDLGRSWYPEQPDSYEWDFDGDGDIEATGPVVSRTIDDPKNTTVTLFVTVDGKRWKAAQDLLDSSMAPDQTARGPLLEVTGVSGFDAPADRDADFQAVAGQQAALDVNIANRGAPRTETVTVSIDGRPVAQRSLEFAQRTTEQLSLSHAIPRDLEPGVYEYEITVDGQTLERTIYVREPALSLELDSLAVPDGNSELLRTGKVKPGKEIRLTVVPTAHDEEIQLSEAVAFSFGDRETTEREVTFDGDSNPVEISLTAPAETGTYQLRGTAVDDEAPVDGFPRRLTVTDSVGIAQVDSVSGECSLNLTSINLDSVSTADSEEAREPENVSVINPGDEVTYVIKALRNDGCPSTPELPLTVGGEAVTTSEQGWITRQYTFTVTRTFESAGDYEIRAGGTRLSTLTVTADSGDDSGTDSGTDGGETEPERESDTNSDSGSESDTTGDPDSESDDTTNPDNSVDAGGSDSGDQNETSEAPESDASGPGFGIGGAVAALGGATYLLGRRRATGGEQNR